MLHLLIFMPRQGELRSKEREGGREKERGEEEERWGSEKESGGCWGKHSRRGTRVRKSVLLRVPTLNIEFARCSF